ncbi:MAG: TIGR03936 family radical SAM-associated protein [Candidatus Promineifilaceae bacterium]
MEATYVQRLRLTFRKFGPARWIGHLDVNRTWERALNRAKIPMAYTQGFNRRPRMQFANALPLGYTSDCEFVDLWLREEIDAAQAMSQLNERMAPGMEVIGARSVYVRQPALPTLTVTALYEVKLAHVTFNSAELRETISALLEQEEVIAEKTGKKNKGKTYNLRPMIHDIVMDENDLLHFNVSCKEGATGRPDAILRALGIDHRDTKVHRQTLTLSDAALLTSKPSKVG